MQPYSDYEIAQWRIAERQRKKTQFRTSIVFMVILILLTVIGREAGACTIPLAIIAGIFVVANGIELYYSTPEHAPSEAEIEQEMMWLFGDDWQDHANAQAYAMAHYRIHMRRIGRWKFIGHLLLFVPINSMIVIGATRSTRSTDAAIILSIAFAWLVIFINHARTTFPKKEVLSHRETRFGASLQSEMAQLQPTRVTPKEKLKRGKYYQVGDDGELEEVEDDALQIEDKPKRDVMDRS